MSSSSVDHEIQRNSTDLESKSDTDSETQEKNLICTICPAKPSFSNYGNRNKHTSEVHNGAYYDCDRCGMVYSQNIGDDSLFSVNFNCSKTEIMLCTKKLAPSASTVTHEIVNGVHFGCFWVELNLVRG